MSKNQNQSAYPITTERYEPEFGLTKRELFAAMALQGLLANPHTFAASSIMLTDGVSLADVAVNQADELLAELGKPEQI